MTLVQFAITHPCFMITQNRLKATTIERNVNINKRNINKTITTRQFAGPVIFFNVFLLFWNCVLFAFDVSTFFFIYKIILCVFFIDKQLLSQMQNQNKNKTHNNNRKIRKEKKHLYKEHYLSYVFRESKWGVQYFMYAAKANLEFVNRFWDSMPFLYF